MATATETRYTPDDLLAITDRPMPELVGGKLVERELMGQEADAVAAVLIYLLVAYSRENFPGVVNGSQGGYRIFADDPKKVRIPDVSFTRKDRLPGGKPEPGHGRIPPDLAVEVVSPNDLAGEINQKVKDYLGAGVALVWIVDPQARLVLLFRQDGSGQFLREEATLDGGSALPGFSCSVATIFEGL